MSGQEQDFQAPIAANLLAEIARTRATNSQLAQALGVSERQITRWRGGQIPRYGFVVRMAHHFDRSPEWFYATHDPTDPSAKAAA